MKLGDCCKSSSISLMDNSCSVMPAAMDAGLTVTVPMIIFIFLYHNELWKSFVLFFVCFNNDCRKTPNWQYDKRWCFLNDSVLHIYV